MLSFLEVLRKETMWRLTLIILLISIHILANSDISNELDQINKAINYNPDAKSWANKLNEKKKQWASVDWQKYPEAEDKLKDLENRIAVLAELQACLEKHGLGTSEIFGKIAAGTYNKPEDVLLLCGSQISALNQIRQIQNFSDKALSQTLVNSAMAELNTGYLDKYIKMSIAANPAGAENYEDYYNKICYQSYTEGSFNGFCEKENKSQSLNWIKSRVENAKGTFSDTKKIAESLEKSITRIKNVYEQVPYRIMRGNRYRNRLAGEAEYSAYIRTYSEEVSKDFGSILMADPLKERFGELAYNDKGDYLPYKGHQTFADMKMSDQTKVDMVKKSAQKSADDFYDQAVILNVKIRNSSSNPKKQLNFLIGSHPHLFGKFLLANKSLVGPMCESIAAIEKDKANSEEMRDFFKQVSAKTGMAFGGAAILSCLSSVFIPVGAPVTAPACAYFSAAAVGSGLVSGATGIMELGNAQGEIDEIMNAWKSGNPSYSTQEYQAARAEVSKAVSGIVEAGMVSAIGSARYLSYASRLGKEGIEGIKTLAGLSKSHVNSEAIANLRKVYKPEEVDDLVLAMNSLRPDEAKALLKKISEIDPQDYRLQELLQKARTALNSCPI